ncbi:MAG: DNA/RNA nuclease SfsA [Alphaproteobacteria bacterium]
MIFQYDEPLTGARLVKRYKRFLADIVLPDGSEVTAHCGNPGAMTGLADPGSHIWVSPNRNPKAKLSWRWEIATQTTPDGPVRVGINTNLANRIVEAALHSSSISELAGYGTIAREVKYGTRNSRIDFLLTGDDRPDCYVEVKSVTLRRPDGDDPSAAQFPDARTERGAKHLAELSDIAAGGGRAVMLYLAQRADCDHFSLARDIDPAYAKAFLEAQDAGVEILCYHCDPMPEGIQRILPLERRD